MSQFKKISFIFPGQGSQYPGMGLDFFKEFSAARLTFEEADDLLKTNLSSIIFQGSLSDLTETKIAQTGIFVVSIAIFRVMKELFDLNPFVCAGLSLGEYTALTAAGFTSFIECLPVILKRGIFMNEACETHKGAMAVILGLDADSIESEVRRVNLPNDLWVANFNCPGQVVISGTVRGIEIGSHLLKEKGAKRIIPLTVHGAFHSGLMKSAEEKLKPFIDHLNLKKGESQLVMNVPGDFVFDLKEIQKNLIHQVTHSVRWEQGIKKMQSQDVDLFIEIGPGKTLSGMNKKMHLKSETIGIEKLEDLKHLNQLLTS